MRRIETFGAPPTKVGRYVGVPLGAWVGPADGEGVGAVDGTYIICPQITESKLIDRLYRTLSLPLPAISSSTGYSLTRVGSSVGMPVG